MKGISSILSRVGTTTVSRALSTSSKRLSLSSISSNLLSVSGTLGITASAGRVSAGGYTAYIHGSEYLNHTAAMQAASRDTSSGEIKKALQLRSQTLKSLQDLKDGSFDFLPFGAFVQLARSKRIAKLGKKMTKGFAKTSSFERIASGTARLNSTLQLLKNRPNTQRAFQVAMQTADLGANAVTNVVAAIATMNMQMKLKIMDHLERIKDNDSMVISFFRKIKRKSSCF